jgi:Acetyltransferases, including N-acetylases of ribosomal proteins
MEVNAKPLKTERLYLRSFEAGDAEMMFASYCHDEEVCRYLTWNPHPDLNATKAFLAFKMGDQVKPYHYAWAITKEGRIIGSIDVVAVYEDKGFEVGYCLEKDAWGQGYMSEAFHAVLSFLYFKAGFNYAIMKADVRNTRSRHVIEKQGFIYDHDDDEDLPLKKTTARVAVYRQEKADFVK